MESDRKPANDRAEPWLDIPDPAARSFARPNNRLAPPRELSLTRSEVRSRRLLALAACVSWPLLVLSASGLRRGANDILHFLAMQTFLWTALVVASLFIALGRGRRGLGGPVVLSMVEAIGIPLLFVVLGLVWLAPGSPTAFGDFGTPTLHGSCLAIGIAVALPMLVVASWSLRRSFPSGAGWRGAAVGASIGLAAASVLTLHCGSTSGGHIALAHGGPILLATLAGAALASKWVKA